MEQVPATVKSKAGRHGARDEAEIQALRDARRAARESTDASEGLTYFQDSLFDLFGHVTVSHGESGGHFTYQCALGSFDVLIPDANTSEERMLFAQYVWNAGLRVADMIVDGTIPVAGRTVLELGAGAGLPSMMAALKGAKRVDMTDYPAPGFLKAMEHNCSLLPTEASPRINCSGYDWAGESDALLAQYDVILACDTIWMTNVHQLLVDTMLKRSNASTQVYVMAGLHTGRACVARFFHTAAHNHLKPCEPIMELPFGSQPRQFVEDRGHEDIHERNKYLIYACLQRDD